jgi:hypothetical protein
LTANGAAGGYNVTATVGALPAANFSLTNTAAPPASVTATAGATQSTAINTAFATALQATVKDASNAPVSGVPVTFTAPGSGATATFTSGATAIVNTNASGIATAPTLTANGTVGPYTVTAAVTGLTPANFSLTNNSAPASGVLTGSGTSATTAANLATEGPADWVHWGDASLTRKSGVTAQISNYAIVGAGAVQTYGNDPRALNWTGGTPTATGTNNLKGVYINAIGNGFSISVPADTTSRTLILHVGGWLSGGTLTAHLSDGSAVDFMDTTALNNNSYDRNYTLTFSALSAGQTLTVKWAMSTGSGNVTLSGAALVH